MNALAHELLSTLSTSGNLRAFLRVIREGETSQTDDAYRTQVYGRQIEDLADHPREVITGTIGGREIRSSAAGAYQFLRRTWDECAAALGLADFGPLAQDVAAVYLIRRRGALADVLAGRVREAIEKCNKEWASLPGSPYGQPTKTLTRALDVYRHWGGVERPDGEPAPIETREVPKEKLMAPFIAAALPSIIEMIPKLGRLFSSGSKSAERNIAAAEAVVTLVQEATGATNAQEAVERIKSDPQALQAAEKAVEERWFALTEAGGGGIDAARKADAEARKEGGPWWGVLRSPSFLIACLLLPLVYLIVLSIIGTIGTAEWSPDVRAAIAGTIVGSIVGGLVGYYYGQTTSRNRGQAAIPGAQA